MTQTIAALFDSVDQAERAMRDIAAEVGGVRGAIYSARTADGIDGLLSVPDEDRAALRENIRRGGAVFHGEVPDERFAAVSDILERNGAADFDEREAAWRREGWTGASATAGTAGTGTDSPLVTGGDTTTTATTAGTTATGTSAPVGGEEVIPVVEERLRVGKRETAHGRVRIRSYVVETPVQEQVTLREERVEVERRPVDPSVPAGDDAFRQRVIEATETAEEAVVAKEARVVEEVVVRKEAEERTETVRDTVRRTEVEVEDERGRIADAPEQRRDRT
jgi:uncharacterized protein (TIGR02271 family)